MMPEFIWIERDGSHIPISKMETHTLDKIVSELAISICESKGNDVKAIRWIKILKDELVSRKNKLIIG